MQRQLDGVAAELLARHVTEIGIDLRLSDQTRSITRIQGSDTDALSIVLGSGEAFEVRAVVIAVGTRPNIELLAEAGVTCNRGVLVDDRMQTSDPSIYAVGEIAEHRGALHGVTAAAEEQAEVAARSIAGDPVALYAGSVAMNILKFADFDLCSMGIPVAPGGETGYDEIVLLDRARGFYKKCIVKDDRLVGAILIGDKAELADFRTLVATGLELADRRDRLLRGGSAVEAPIGKVVCSCGNVGAGNIERVVGRGHDTLESVCAASGAGVGCGSCKPEIRRILDALVAIR
jgi:ferredoxin-nitrate reductase